MSGGCSCEKCVENAEQFQKNEIRRAHARRRSSGSTDHQAPEVRR